VFYWIEGDLIPALSCDSLKIYNRQTFILYIFFTKTEDSEKMKCSVNSMEEEKDLRIPTN
jgi:hypothetical protein